MDIEVRSSAKQVQMGGGSEVSGERRALVQLSGHDSSSPESSWKWGEQRWKLALERSDLNARFAAIEVDEKL